MIRAKEIKLVPIDEIKLNPKNRNKHPKKQIKRLAKILKDQGFRRPVTVSNRTGLLVCGEGRFLAAKELDFTEIPVMFQDYDSDEQEFADAIADNAIDKWAELDTSGILEDVKLLDEFELDLLGIEDIEKLDRAGTSSSSSGSSENSPYTAKIKSPIYTPKGEKPSIKELYDLSKTQALLAEIDKLDLPDNDRVFLKVATYRHVVFNYAKIADYYAHSSKEVQQLMEDSALVIIDFNKAIEKNFVVMAEELAGAYADDAE